MCQVAAVMMYISFLSFLGLILCTDRVKSAVRDTTTTMHSAVIYRGTGRNSFAVQMQHWPGQSLPQYIPRLIAARHILTMLGAGVVEIHCADICTQDRAEFDKLTRSISPTDANSLLNVSVTLGEYCLAKRAFVNCSMHYPSAQKEDVVDEWYPVIQHMQSDLAVKQQPSPRKRERFTSTSQAGF
jgi:hypothetical protein